MVDYYDEEDESGDEDLHAEALGLGAGSFVYERERSMTKSSFVNKSSSTLLKHRQSAQS